MEEELNTITISVDLNKYFLDKKYYDYINAKMLDMRVKLTDKAIWNNKRIKYLEQITNMKEHNFNDFIILDFVKNYYFPTISQSKYEIFSDKIHRNLLLNYEELYNLVNSFTHFEEINEKMIDCICAIKDNDLSLDYESVIHLKNFIKNGIPYAFTEEFVKYYFRKYYEGKYELDYYSTKELIESLGLSILNKNDIQGSCIVKPASHFANQYDRFIIGRYIRRNNVIEISDLTIMWFLQNVKKDNHELFITLFHEIEHAIQNKRMKSIPEYKDFESIKDILLDPIDDEHDFYGINYENSYFEVDARIKANEKYKCCSSEMGYKPLHYKEQIVDKFIHNNNKQRYIFGKSYPLDIVFNSNFKRVMDFWEFDDIDIFEHYPILNEFYTKDAKRKTTLELLKRYESLNDEDEQLKDLIKDVIIKTELSLEDLIDDIKELKNNDFPFNKSKFIYYKFIRSSIRNLDSYLRNIAIYGFDRFEDIIESTIEYLNKIVESYNKKSRLSYGTLSLKKTKRK